MKTIDDLEIAAVFVVSNNTRESAGYVQQMRKVFAEWRAEHATVPSATRAIPEGWKLVPDTATDAWAADFLSGVLNEDRHTASKIERAKSIISEVLGVAPVAPSDSGTKP